MSDGKTRSRKARLKNTFRYPDRFLLFGKACLYDDRIELTGWAGLRPTKRVLALDEIEEIHWWAGRADVNLALYLHSGEDVLLFIKGVGSWKFKLEGLVERRLTIRASLPASEPDDVLPPKVKSLGLTGDRKSHAA